MALSVKERERMIKLQEKEIALEERLSRYKNKEGKAYLKTLEQRKKVTAEIIGLEQKARKTASDTADEMEIQRDAAKEILALNKTLEKTLKKSKLSNSEISAAAAKFTGHSKEALKAFDGIQKRSGEVADGMGGFLDVSRLSQDELDAIATSGLDTIATLNSEFEDAASVKTFSNGLQVELNDLIEEQAALGADATQGEKDLLKAKIHGKQIEADLAATKVDQIETQEAINEATEGMKGLLGDSFGLMWDIANANPVEAAMLAVTAILTTIQGQITAIGDAYGVAGVQDMHWDFAMAEAKAKQIGKGMEEIIAVTSTLTDEFGFTVENAAALSNQITDSAKAMAMSDEEAAQLTGFLMTQRGLSAEIADKQMKQAYQFARMNKVNPAKAMKSIAKSTEYFSKYGIKSMEAMVKTQISAQKLGMELDEINNMADGFLNVQESINNEMMFEAVTGKQLELTEIRRLALAGKHEEMLDAVKTQVQAIGQEEWDLMNVKEKELFANAVNMSLPALEKALGLQEDLVDESKKFEDMSFTEIVGQDAMDQLSRLIGHLDSLATYVATYLAPPIVFVTEVFANLAAGISWLVGTMMQSIPGMIAFGAILAKLGGRALVSAIMLVGKGIGKAFAMNPLLGLGAAALGGSLIYTIYSKVTESKSKAASLSSGAEVGTELAGVTTDSWNLLHKGETVMNKEDTEMLGKTIQNMRALNNTPPPSGKSEKGVSEAKFDELILAVINAGKDNRKGFKQAIQGTL